MRIHRQVRIACPPNVLWQYLIDDDLIRTWLPSHLQNVPDDPSTDRVGGWSTLTLQVGKRIGTYRCLITEWRPNERIAMHVQGAPFDKKLDWDISYDISCAGSDAVLDCEVEIPLGDYGIMAIIVGPALWLVISGNLKKQLSVLSTVCTDHAC
jgi:hypothetical protein